MTHTVLIVDDDPTQRRLLQAVIERNGYRTLQAASADEMFRALDGVQGADVGLVLLDLVMPQEDGLSALKRLRPSHAALPVIVLTAQGGIETVVSAMRAGADDFLVKPASPERILVSIRNALKVKALTGEVQRLKKRASGHLSFGDLIAKSAAMRTVVRLGERAAQSNIPILIEGESGVGKEVLARAIQQASDRANKPFVAVNCGAIPENLIESILFGHEKGSFTGASEKHIGKFQEADGGTLFLDEIGELRLDMQVKLLRAIQEGEVDPIGAKRPVKINIRLISATNRNLTQLAQEGRFREDLYYRLNVFPIQVPPLRERMEDLPELIQFFVERFAAEEGKSVIGIDETALKMLGRHAWPGNIRQLENTVFRGVVLCDSDQLKVEDFPQIAAQLGVELRTEEHAVEQVAASTQTYAKAVGHDVGYAVSAPAAYTGGNDAGTVRLHNGLEIKAMDGAGHLRRLEEIENDLIRFAIELYDGHMSEVARRLGIGRSTLYRKMREIGLGGKGFPE
ncbi:MAG: sigma-54-dependent Fis family transcriptional regulator [Alphaproteobacteria bacterium]|nr:sigma-54-dependent Fis family transcriptional regulator [Alphaproteobacteria bacterium]